MGSDPRFTGKSGILAKFVKFCTFKKVRNSENFANCTFRTFAHFVKCAKCEIRESCESCELRSAQSIEQLGRSSGERTQFARRELLMRNSDDVIDVDVSRVDHTELLSAVP
jgi:hypothetical protein